MSNHRFEKMTGSQRLIRLAASGILLAASLMQSCMSLALPANAAEKQRAAFERTWQRTDLPVKNGMVARTWIWGPTQNATGFEPYQQSPGGQREVVYWDKSRMEINQPAGDPANKWYVTNGLLVKEMISGLLQIGDAQFKPYTPAEEAIAGDAAAINPDAPTYRSFRNIASLDNDRRAANRVGQPLIEQVFKSGAVDASAGLSRYGVSYSFYEPALGHNLPNVFTRFFEQKGTVYENGQFVNGTVFDWIYAAGLPLTEPYWTRVKVSGIERDVLVQAFERRVLTYTPDNAAGWQVEMGNVGLHYMAWRYPASNGFRDVADPDNPNSPRPAGYGSGSGGGGNGSGSESGSGGGAGTTTPGSGGPGSGSGSGGGSGGSGSGGGTTTPGAGDGEGSATATPTTGTGGGTGTPSASPECLDFALSVGGPISIQISGNGKATVSVGSLQGCQGTVELSVSGQAAGVSANLSASTVTLSPGSSANVDLNVAAAPGALPGNLNLTITGKAGGKVKTATLGVNVLGAVTVGATVSVSVGLPGTAITPPVR